MRLDKTVIKPLVENLVHFANPSKNDTLKAIPSVNKNETLDPIQHCKEYKHKLLTTDPPKQCEQCVIVYNHIANPERGNDADLIDFRKWMKQEDPYVRNCAIHLDERDRFFIPYLEEARALTDLSGTFARYCKRYKIIPVDTSLQEHPKPRYWWERGLLGQLPPSWVDLEEQFGTCKLKKPTSVVFISPSPSSSSPYSTVVKASEMARIKSEEAEALDAKDKQAKKTTAIPDKSGKMESKVGVTEAPQSTFKTQDHVQQTKALKRALKSQAQQTVAPNSTFKTQTQAHQAEAPKS